MVQFRTGLSRDPSIRPGRLVVSCLLALALPVLGQPPVAAEKKTAGAPPGGEAWPEITAEERSFSAVPQDPDAEAVLLRHDRVGKILKQADDTVNIMQEHWRLKVLRPSGSSYAAVTIPASRGSRVSDLEARTIKPDGTVVPVPPDQIFDKVRFEIGSYKVTEKVFHFPAVEPGVILEYRFQRRDDFLLSIRPWYFEGPVFTLRSRFEQSVPAGMGYLIGYEHCGTAKPEVLEWREGKVRGQTYALELRNLPGYRHGLFMPPAREVSPHMELVLQEWKGIYFERLGRQDRCFIDWPSVVKFVRTSYQDSFKKGVDQLQALVDGWVKGVADPVEKARVVFRHVQQDFRYVAFDEVAGYSRPLPEILKSGWADNEEKAPLLQAALQAAGVASEVALVSGRHAGPVNPKFYSLAQFTHAVVLLTAADGTTKLLDPTLTYAPFGFVSWRDSGAAMLRLREGETAIGSLPERTELSLTRRRVGVRPLPDGRAELEIEVRYTGEDAVDMRDDLVPLSDSSRIDYLREWLDDARPGATLRSHEFENLDKLEEPLVLKVKADTGGLVTLAEGAAVVRACVLNCFDGNPISRAFRQDPLYVDRGWNDEQAVIIRAPEGMKAPAMPPPAVARTAVTTLALSCTSRDDGSTACTRTFMARRSRWAPSEMTGVRAMFDKVVEADRTAVTFQSAGGN